MNVQEEQQKLEEENVAALRAAAEAISISRITLETTMAQGEQLQHCDDINERNKYIIDKSARIVRGLTWSGWMMNIFSKDSEPPPTKRSESKSKSEQPTTFTRTKDSGSYSYSGTTNVNGANVSDVLIESEVANLPQELQKPACMLQNYECNVLLLEKCQDKLEHDACLEICKKLYISAKKVMEDAVVNNKLERTHDASRSLQSLRKLEKKLEEVHDLHYRIGIVQPQRQRQPQWIGQGLQTAEVPSSERQNDHDQKEGTALWNNKKEDDRPWAKTETSNTRNTLQQRIDKQDEHLDALAGNIQELLHNGAAIGTTLESQNQLLVKLESDTDDLTENTKMVSRRADRLSHRSVSCFFVIHNLY